MVNAVVYLGIAAFALGVLIYFAARSFGGGLAGTLILALIAWPFIEGAWLAVRAIWRLHLRVKRRHETLAGCLGLIVVCAVGGYVWTSGAWAILGLLAV